MQLFTHPHKPPSIAPHLLTPEVLQLQMRLANQLSGGLIPSRNMEAVNLHDLMLKMINQPQLHSSHLESLLDSSNHHNYSNQIATNAAIA